MGREQAHSAVYDAERTADVFCFVCNRLHDSFRDAQDAHAHGVVQCGAGDPADSGGR